MLIKEESINEFTKAYHENDTVEMLDSIADALYVLYGLCYTYKFDPDHYVKLVYGTKYESNYQNIKNHYSNDNNILDLHKENCELELALRKALLEDKDIVTVYITTMCMIVNEYKLGILLGYNVDKVFDIVHSSNMSKVCRTEKEAQDTVQSYLNKIASGDNTYDSPYYYENNGYYIVKNKSSGKSLKSINYTAVKFNLEELHV